MAIFWEKPNSLNSFCMSFKSTDQFIWNIVLFFCIQLLFYSFWNYLCFYFNKFLLIFLNYFLFIFFLFISFFIISSIFQSFLSHFLILINYFLFFFTEWFYFLLIFWSLKIIYSFIGSPRTLIIFWKNIIFILN